MTRPLPLLISLLALTASALVLAGCQNGSDAPAAPAAPEAPGAPAPPATPTAGATAEGEDHAHAAPHGGTVKTAGAGHLELVVDGRNLKVYPLDGSEAALSVAGITGAQVIVQPQSGEAATMTLAPMGDHLMATLPEGVTAFTAIVTVPVAGEPRTAQFEYGLDGHAHAH